MTEVIPTPLPRPVKNLADERFKPAATVLYRAMQSRGQDGLSWRECWLVLDAEGMDAPVGPLVTWMRSKGVSVLSTYVAGETRFLLEVAPTP